MTLDDYIAKDDYTAKDEDDTQELIVNLSFTYGLDEHKDHLSSEEQCQALRASPASHGINEDMFLRSLEKITSTVSSILSTRNVSDKQMMRYKAEFDTWFLHTIDILKMCDSAPYMRINNVISLVRCCIFNKWDYSNEKITAALADLYTHKTWGQFVGGFLEYGSSQESKLNMVEVLVGQRYTSYDVIDTSDRINLYIKILVMVGDDPRRICKMYWMHDARICTTYILHLLKENDKLTALRVASIGLDIFADSDELAVAILESFGTRGGVAVDTTETEEETLLLMARCRIYATSLDYEHYAMAKASTSWSKAWARRLTAMLAARGHHESEISVLMDAGMHREAVDALRYDGTLQAAISHRHDLVASHPNEYYDACKILVENASKHGMSKTHREMIRQCLRAMKYVPGRRSDFEEFCHLLLRDSIHAAFSKTIKEVVSLS